MLAGVEIESFDMSTTLFGRTFATPLVISPIGVQSQLHAEADLATARAASSLQVPFTLSSATSTPMEKVAEAGEWADAGEGEESGAEGWFQLYWPADDDLTKSLLGRAKKAGYKVLVVTLDTWSLGWRPQDLDQGYNPFLHGNGVGEQRPSDLGAQWSTRPDIVFSPLQRTSSRTLSLWKSTARVSRRCETGRRRTTC